MKSSTVTAMSIAGAVLTLALAEVAVHAETLGMGRPVPKTLANFTSGPAAQPLELRQRIVYVGADLDGDGQPDVADPTGGAPRSEDAYGEGRFHARRDGGERQHEGVDYVAVAGQPVEAPISGYVTKIGYAYPDDQSLRFVEIENPALHLTARAFYVDPQVAVGDAVAVGHPIGRAHTLQRRYPQGITDHIHLELADARGRKLDAENLIIPRAETATVVAAD